MIEEWRPIVGYEGLYEVSNTGQVRSFDRYVKYSNGRLHLHKGKVLSPIKDRDGYLQVNLCYSGRINSIKIHRLVAQAFIPNSDNLPYVNHKDEVKTNNSVDNLEWCDVKYNNNYGSRKDKARDTLIKNGYWTGLRCGLSKKEYNLKYYQDNKEKLREYYHQYYLKKKEHIQKIKLLKYD